MMKSNDPMIILIKTLHEVLEKHQSLCLDNESERALLTGLIVGAFSRLTIENQEKTNEPTDH